MKLGSDNSAKPMEHGMKAAAAQIEKATAMGKENVEAVVQSTTIMAKGCEEMSKNLWSWVQTLTEQSMATSKQALSVKTLRELVDLQSAYMRDLVDQSMTETTKISEIGARVANQAMEPINRRVHDFVEAVRTKAA